MKSVLFKNTFSIFLIFFVLFLFSVYLLSSTQVYAQTSEIYGSAWSYNVGWISFNHCESEGVNCSPQSYSVEVDSNGWISGAAWSSNVGWIKFGGLSGFPSGGGTVAENARINLSDGKVTGWARACAGTSPGDCSSMQSASDGWDGWISLSGTRHPSPNVNGAGGVTYLESEKKMVGKAWGGDVVGWVDFGDALDGGQPNVFLDASEEFDYTLENSTETTQLEIEQGNSRNFSVTRVLVSGEPESVLLTAVDFPPVAGVSMDSGTNNPCPGEVWSGDTPNCTSVFNLSVDQSVAQGPYSFVIEGEDVGQGTRETTINFNVIPPSEALEISCSVSGGPFTLYQKVVWGVDSYDPEVIDSFTWSGDLGNDYECIDENVCNEIETSYSTIGFKSVSVEAWDDGDPPQSLATADCDSIFVGLKIQFREI